MKKPPILPATQEEVLKIRKDPQKPIKFPTYANHKGAMILYYLLLLFLIVMYILGIITGGIPWSYYLFVLIAMSNLHNFLNVFAIVDDGLLCGSRFIAWKKVKSFQFIPIDKDHRFYGYSKEVNNDSYELIIEQRIFPISLIVTSKEMKEKMAEVLNKHLTQSRDVYKIEQDK